MYRLKYYLIFIISISMLPSSGADDRIYRVDGLPDNLYYETGKTYEVVLTANNYTAIQSIDITVTNGSLSETEEFGAVLQALSLSSSETGWSFFWQAPIETFELGEGISELSVIFNDKDGSNWSYFESILRPPQITSHDASSVPQCALSLAWTGVSITALVTIIGAIVLRRDRLT